MNWIAFSKSCKTSISEKEAVRQHVLHCRRCHVTETGDVYYCSTANEIIQKHRKQRFFGNNR